MSYKDKYLKYREKYLKLSQGGNIFSFSPYEYIIDLRKIGKIEGVAFNKQGIIIDEQVSDINSQIISILKFGNLLQKSFTIDQLTDYIKNHKDSIKKSIEENRKAGDKKYKTTLLSIDSNYKTLADNLKKILENPHGYCEDFIANYCVKI